MGALHKISNVCQCRNFTMKVPGEEDTEFIEEKLKTRPLTWLQPSCSMISGGKTLEAKALRKMALNSWSRPPMPILLKSQSGLMMDCRTTLPLDLPLSCTEEPSPFSKMTLVLGMLMPTLGKLIQVLVLSERLDGLLQDSTYLVNNERAATLSGNHTYVQNQLPQVRIMAPEFSEKFPKLLS